MPLDFTNLLFEKRHDSSQEFELFTKSNRSEIIESFHEELAVWSGYLL